MDLGVRKFFSESESNASGSRTYVDDVNRDSGRPASIILISQLQHGFDDVLSFGAGYEHCARHDEVHAPEFLVSSDVLCRDAAGALAQRILQASLFFSCEFAFGMSEKIGAVAAEREHDKQLGIHARRAYLGGRETIDGRRERVLKCHAESHATI